MITTTDKADFLRHHQRNWQGSGLSQKAYCQQHNLSYHVSSIGVYVKKIPPA
jgi:hypothetical protein